MVFNFNSMFCKKILVILTLIKVSTSSNEGFIFNGFNLDHQNQSFLQLSGAAELRNDIGLFKLTNGEFQIGRVFCSVPFKFKNSSNVNASSFSTTFVFAIVPEHNSRGNGLAFALAPSKEFRGIVPSPHLGLFNRTNHGNSSNHIVAIELDTFPNREFEDIDDNHVGIDINGLKSAKFASAGYVSSRNSEFTAIDLASGERIQLWVEYDGAKHQLNVTLSPIFMTKPKVPLLSMDIDLSPFMLENMYVGLSSGTGSRVASTYVLGWSFQMNGNAEDLDVAKLSSIPKTSKKNSWKINELILKIGLSLAGVFLFTIISCSVIFVLSRKKAKSTDDQILEDWEVQLGPHRFHYNDLFVATKGFNEKELLGQGGFRQVYRGELPVLKIEIAVKRIFRKSEQGMEEFIAEIATIGRLRHPNLVRLLGYCRGGKDELLLVYDYMPNGSLDKFLHKEQELGILNWNQRFSIIKDIASALAYLHEGCMESIIHRDIKASNVLLDDELNGKLGDFGLARCGKHTEETTHVAGTFGYIAPELARNGKASKSTDVYAFGVFCLEVVCGRRPIKPRASVEEVHLVDWVFKCWNEGDILGTADSKLLGNGKGFDVEQVDLVLKLGLLCVHNVAAFRPTMSQVNSYLKGQTSLPQNLNTILARQEEPMEEYSSYNSAPSTWDSVATFALTESFQSHGR